MRIFRMAALGASMIALLSACSTGGGATQTPTAGATPTPGATPSAATIASTLIFGGPPECPERPFCLIGLQETYELEFAEFKPLDVGGPITVAALESGDVDVGLLFTSDPTIDAKGFVELEDDKQLQNADNLTPVVSSATLEEFPEIADILDPVSAAITQEQLVALNQRVGIDQEDPDVVAGEWLTEQGLLEGEPSDEGKGPVTVGKTNFYEQDVLSEIYAQALRHAGFEVAIAEASGNREVVFPTLESGEIDILPEYLATALEFVNGGAGQATPDAEETAELFREAAAERGLTVLDPAPATDQNTIVVTQETADQYGLVKISDLAKPAP
jgi:glycine betaine/choline ABC-type transport system substrate-binding protein